MKCRGSEFARRDVVSIRDGQRIGFGCDFEFDAQSARITALVLPGRKRLFGLLGKEEDRVIPWEFVKVVGSDAVLIDFQLPRPAPRAKSSFFENILD